MCSLFHVSWDIFAVVSDFDICKARISGGEWNIWLPLGAFFSFCQAYLNQEFVGGSSFEVLSSHLLEDRLLRGMLLVLVGSGEFVFWAMTDELRSSEKLDVRLLRGRDEFDAFGLWGVCCSLGGVLVVWLKVLVAWGVVGDVVGSTLW